MSYLSIINDPTNVDSPNIWAHFAAQSEIYVELVLAFYGLDTDPLYSSYPGTVSLFRAPVTTPFGPSAIAFSQVGDDIDPRPWGYGLAEGDSYVLGGGPIETDTQYKLQLHLTNTGIIASGPGAGEHGYQLEVRIDDILIDTVNGYATGSPGTVEALLLSANGGGTTTELPDWRIYSAAIGTTGWGSSDLLAANYDDGTTTTLPGPWTGYEEGTSGGIIDIIDTSASSVVFDASTSTGSTPLEYEWDFGDGETDTGVTPTHEYDESGVYSVILTVTDNLGRTDEEIQDVTVP